MTTRSELSSGCVPRFVALLRTCATLSLSARISLSAVSLCTLFSLFTPLLLTAPAADAALAPASVIDGPSSAILDVDGAAMASDGSGGIVYRKLVGDQPHLFVARFLGGVWQAPIQVDGGQEFGASFPAIAAGNGGRLLVVWAEPWAVIDQATHFQLMSSELLPGAQTFGPAIQIDPKDIGDGTATYPSLTMAPNGQAYVAYRVVTDSLIGGTITPLRPGDELIDVRVARYNGEGLAWTALGAVNSHPELTMRHPSASNAPAIGVSITGHAVVTWQEPDASGDGTARIWARRIFGSRLGNVLEVSPESVNGQPIQAEADAPAIAVSKFGEAEVAYRLAGGSGSPYGTPRILLNNLPSETDPAGAAFKGALVVGGGATVGPPSVSIDERGDFQLSYTSAGVTQSLSGDDFSGLRSPLPLGPASSEGVPSTINPAGGSVSAWATVGAGGLPVVAAREGFANGAWQQAQLSAPISGPLSTPVLGGSGQGDALIAFRQGPPDRPQVMAAVAKSPPGAFLAYGPVGWVTAGAATIQWNQPAEAFGNTTYALLVDGHVRASRLSKLSIRVSPGGLGDGVHHIQVLATDSLGQQTMTPDAELKIDSTPPQVSVKRRPHHRVLVRVVDRASGVAAGKTSIEFGDGSRASHKTSARHTYAHAGKYTITVHSRDKVGHVLRARIPVAVR